MHRNRQPIQTAAAERFQQRFRRCCEYRNQLRPRTCRAHATNSRDEIGVDGRFSRVIQNELPRIFQRCDQRVKDGEGQVRPRSAAQLARAEDAIQRALRRQFDPKNPRRSRRIELHTTKTRDVTDSLQRSSIKSGISRAHLGGLLFGRFNLYQRTLSHAGAVVRRLLPFAATLHQFGPEGKRTALRRLGG